MLTTLYNNFLNPSRKHSIQPFWFWNTDLTRDEIERQIDEMIKQGVYGAHIHNRSGLRPRYLSEDWWELIQVAVKKAEAVGFDLYVCDEFNWPSGEVRDFTQRGFPSQVIATNPDFRMRSLTPQIMHHYGDQPLVIELPGTLDLVIVGRVTTNDAIDPTTLQNITDKVGTGWHAPDGLWRIYTFTLQPTIGVDGGQVDLMNPEAVKTFLTLIYEAYRKRVGTAFGKIFKGFYSDHEGDYGWRIAWTPTLFAEFKARKGYELTPHLPLLMDEGGDQTPIVRCDYFDVVSQLYSEAFWQQLTDWCNEHEVRLTGHVWEESLQSQVAFQGDHFQIQRAMQTPGVDSLFEWGRYARHFKEASSVADFRGIGYTVENQGVQGVDSYLSIEGMRRTTNMLGIWGASTIIPHAFNASNDRIDFPEDWFERQPYWKYFHHYASHASRICYMNSNSQHICDIAVYYPIESVWAHGDVCFDEAKWHMNIDAIDTERGHLIAWGNVVDELNQVYGDILDRLPCHLWDYNIVDAHYLAQATVTQTTLDLAHFHFSCFILPPMTTIRRASAEKIRMMVQAGVKVIVVQRLPFDSMEGGRHDPHLLDIWRDIFGEEILNEIDQFSTENPIYQHETAYFVTTVDYLIQILEQHHERAVEVLTGDKHRFFAHHRIKDGHDIYWLVNNTPTEKVLKIQLRSSGKLSCWHPEDGTISQPLHYTQQNQTIIHLTLDAWQGVYVVFDDERQAIATQSIEVTNLRQIAMTTTDAEQVLVSALQPANGQSAEMIIYDGQSQQQFSFSALSEKKPLLLGGLWHFKPISPMTPMTYARTNVTRQNVGEAIGWYLPDYNDEFWEQVWLSPEQFVIRDWWLCGLFDYDDHEGYYRDMAPEKEVDLHATYQGRNDASIRWQKYRTPHRVVDFDIALGTSPKEKEVSLRNVTAFAFTYVYVPQSTIAQYGSIAQLRITADSNVRAYWNDEGVIDERDDHHAYLEMRDAYGIATDIHLKAGWNKLLLKVSQGNRYGGMFGFVTRICKPNGQILPDIIATHQTDSDIHQRLSATSDQQRWYRVQVPIGATGVHLPSANQILAVYGDGQHLKHNHLNQVVLPNRVKVLTVHLVDDMPLQDAITFVNGSADVPLQSLSKTGLSFYSGDFEYTKHFELDAAWLNYRLWLDLGEVGTVAQVWVNDCWVGERVWSPYKFEITDVVVGGQNTLRVLVTNTASQQRAGGHIEYELWDIPVRGIQMLEKLYHNGLLGDVQITAQKDVSIILKT